MKRKHDSMFLKFHHFQHHQQPPHHHNHETSEEDETRNTVGRGGGQTNHHPHHNNNNQDNHEIVVFPSKKVQKHDEYEPINNSGSSGGCGGVSDGATTQIVRRPRGRPPGSKNKPKPQPTVTQNTIDDECGMRTHLLEIPAGLDIITSISGFSRRQDTGLCVLSGSGTVTNVSLRQPLSITPGATVTFHGQFELLSMSATILPPSSYLSSFNGFTISLAGTQGHIFGGSVVGSLIAAGTVFVVASSFHSPSFHRLQPIEDDDRNSISSEERESNNPSDQLTDESWSMPMYHHHLPSDVIWTPNT